MGHFETAFLLFLCVTFILVEVVVAGRGKRDHEVVTKSENIDANQASIPFLKKLLTMEKLAACNVLLFQDRGM